MIVRPGIWTKEQLDTLKNLELHISRLEQAIAQIVGSAPGDIAAAILAHTNSADNATDAEVTAAIAAHTASTSNVTEAELDAAITLESQRMRRVAELHMLQDDPIEGEMGPPGIRGIEGVSGVPGPALFMLAEDGENGADGVPGPQGPAGVSGNGDIVDGFPLMFDYECHCEMPPYNGDAALLNRHQVFRERQVIEADVASTNNQKYQTLLLKSIDEVTLGLSLWNADASSPVDAKRGALIQAFGVLGLVCFNDDASIQRNGLLIDRLTATGVQITSMRYGNTTDNPVHRFSGGIQQNFLLGGSTPNPIAVATENSISFVKRMRMVSTQRLTLSGTARLRVTN